MAQSKRAHGPEHGVNRMTRTLTKQPTTPAATTMMPETMTATEHVDHRQNEHVDGVTHQVAISQWVHAG